MPQVVLETERLRLRRFTAGDVELLVALDSDPEVMRFITGGLPTSREEIETEVLPAWLAHYTRYAGYGFYAAEQRDTGEFLGWFHLRPGEGAGADEPELGYRLLRAAWGQGYASEGSRALVDWAFGELGATRVNAETMVVNAASRRVMENVGMRAIRVFHQPWPFPIPGDEHGDVEYSITRAEWLNRSGRRPDEVGDDRG